MRSKQSASSFDPFSFSKEDNSIDGELLIGSQNLSIESHKLIDRLKDSR